MHTDVNDTDLVVQMTNEHADRCKAEQRARFNLAVEAEVAKYRKRCKVKRKVYHWLSQLSMILVGIAGVGVAMFATAESSWRTLVSVSVLAVLLTFSRWCHKKSRRSRHE